MDERQRQRLAEVVETAVTEFAERFRARHFGEYKKPLGIINSKANNIFVSALDPEVVFYSALVRSLDSSLGSLVEGIALKLAEHHFEVSQHVEGRIYTAQTTHIAALLEDYKARRRTPSIDDYSMLRELEHAGAASRRHESDYVLRHRLTGVYSLIELKLGGDLDNKKARSEKEALLEQYCILCNELGEGADVRMYFATAYNRYGEGSQWKQERVRQFFANEELLIGRDFWNFVIQDSSGYDVLIEAYRNAAQRLRDAVMEVKRHYAS